MPKADSKDTLVRQWEMLKLLDTRYWLTTSEITERLAGLGYGVDQRTVQRDLEKLSTVFLDIDCNKKSAPFGWRWKQGADLGVRGLSVSEALTLKMVDEFLAPMLPASMLESLRPRLKQATEKLDSLEAADNPAARWTEKIRVVHPVMNMVAPDVRPEVMETVQEGLLREKQIEVGYHRIGTDAPSAHRIHPLAMVQRGPVTYLVCTVFDYSDIRLYALHRMVTATLLDDAIEWPQGFSIDNYIREGHLHFGNGGDIFLKLWVSKDAGSYLRESPLEGDMRMQESGDGYEVTATVRDTMQLKWWLLSRGRDAIVLEPAEFREKMIFSLRDALDGYRKNS